MDRVMAFIPRKGIHAMAENIATLKCIRSQVLKIQNDRRMKLIFPALYAELIAFAICVLLSNKITSGLEVTSLSLVVVFAVVITIAYVQMKRLDNKLMQVRYLIFDSDLFEKETWTESERATAVEYAKDSLSFMQINTIAYVFSLVNLFALTLIISMFL